MVADPTGRPGTRLVVGRLLRGGLATAATLLLVGAVWKLVTGDPTAPALRLGGLTVSFDADAVLAGGVLILAITPLVRVATLTIAWLREGDRRFAAVAATVLALLIAGLVLGHV